MADYGSEQDDADALLALLYATADLTVYPDAAGGPSTVPVDALPPYVSVHFTTEHTPVGERMTHRSNRSITRAFANCVGANAIAARAMAAKVRTAWLDVKPTISGRSVYPIRHEQTRPADVTEPVAQTTVTITAIYRLESEPGA